MQTHNGLKVGSLGAAPVLFSRFSPGRALNRILTRAGLGKPFVADKCRRRGQIQDAVVRDDALLIY
jgi:hypothetical protein